MFSGFFEQGERVVSGDDGGDGVTQVLVGDDAAFKMVTTELANLLFEYIEKKQCLEAKTEFIHGVNLCESVDKREGVQVYRKRI